MRTCTRVVARAISRGWHIHMPYIVSLDTHRTAPPGHCDDWRPCDNEPEERERERERERRRYTRRSVNTGAPGVPAPRSERLPSPSIVRFYSLLTRSRQESERLCNALKKSCHEDFKCSVFFYYGDYNNYYDHYERECQFSQAKEKDNFYIIIHFTHCSDV